MSIFPAVVSMLRAEHEYRPITGDVILIGRQSIEGGCVIDGVPIKDDVELFKHFGAQHIEALDVSPYEGAEIIHNLNNALPINLFDIADFIFDGSCLDNIFDPANALRSLSKMLRSGGRMMLMEHGTAIQGALTSFSPEWFFDYFAVNRYDDCQIKLCMFPDGMQQSWNYLHWQPFDAQGAPKTASPGVHHGDFVSVVIAEKGERSTDGQSPVQAQYRLLHGADNDRYLEAHRRFLASGRRS